MCFHCSLVLGLETICKKKGGREEGSGLQLQVAWSTNTPPAISHSNGTSTVCRCNYVLLKEGEFLCCVCLLQGIVQEMWSLDSCKLLQSTQAGGFELFNHLRIVIQIGNHPIWTRGKDDKHLKPKSKYSISGLSSCGHRACCFFQADLTVPNWAEKLKTPITTRRATVAPRKNHSASKLAKTC